MSWLNIFRTTENVTTEIYDLWVGLIKTTTHFMLLPVISDFLILKVKQYCHACVQLVLLLLQPCCVCINSIGTVPCFSSFLVLSSSLLSLIFLSLSPRAVFLPLSSSLSVLSLSFSLLTFSLLPSLLLSPLSLPHSLLISVSPSLSHPCSLSFPPLISPHIFVFPIIFLSLFLSPPSLSSLYSSLLSLFLSLLSLSYLFSASHSLPSYLSLSFFLSPLSLSLSLSLYLSLSLSHSRSLSRSRS